MRGFFYLLFLCLTSSAVAQSIDSIQSLQPTLIYGEANCSTPVSIVSVDRACIQLKNTGHEPLFIPEQATEEQFDDFVNVHFKGVFFLTQKLLPFMNVGGRIINL